ncbi:MAG: 30S ribosomal protein S16 [Clostridia bacterium]
MAVRIRLTRLGDKKSPFYRVVVADSRTARDGKVIEQIGTYDPLKNPAEININTELAKKWIANGAQPTETAKSILQTAGVIEVKGNSVAKTNNKKKKAKYLCKD